MINRLQIIILAFGHGVNDLIAGYFLSVIFLSGVNPTTIALSFLIYNLLAFGGQYPFGLLLLKTGNPERWLSLACIFNILAVIFFKFSLPLAITFTGIGSAIYHVSGGTICSIEGKSFPIGVFAAPGVAGLIAGGWMASSNINVLAFAGLSMFLLFAFTLKMKPGHIKRKFAAVQPPSLIPDRHDIVMIILLLVTSMRSVIWNVFQLIHDKEWNWLLLVALSAMIGKIAGGWIADRIGWRLYVYFSLAGSIPFLYFFRDKLVLFCIGIGLLQSGIPATTAMMINASRGKPSIAIALSFGTAIFLGGVMMYLPGRFLLFNGSGIMFLGIGIMLLMWLVSSPRVAYLQLLKEKIKL